MTSGPPPSPPPAIPAGHAHLIARRLVDVTPWLGSLAASSRDFH
jgi:hypothetical protein